MKVSLVIMAAGLGSRYGGSKQIDGIGPHNEILMEYGIYDALRAGFNKVVFIIKPDMAELMDRLRGGGGAACAGCGGRGNEKRKRINHAHHILPGGRGLLICRAFLRLRGDGHVDL